MQFVELSYGFAYAIQPRPSNLQIEVVPALFWLECYYPFEDWDLVLCPAYTTVAFSHDDRPIEQRSHCVDGHEQEYFQPMFWAGLATPSYLPATVFPAGRTEGGLPIGLQLVGGQYRDHLTIQAARLMAQCAGHETALPPL